MADVTVKDASGNVMKLVNVDGYRVCNMGRDPEEHAQLVRNIKHLTCRDDDVFLIAPVKSGTHWMFEIASMLINKRAETIEKNKARHMLELESAEYIDAVQPSPRILNSHLSLRLLPEQLFEKQCKIIFVVRHPKDMCVSWYHHVRGISYYEYDGKWEDFLQLMLANELENGSWFDFIKEWEEYMKAHSSHPVHFVTYEQLHEDNIGELKRLAAFLNVDADDELIASISSKCCFRNMRTDKDFTADVRDKVCKGDFNMYRKGTTGDWKNQFTVNQSEQFDRIYKREMEHCKLLPDYI